MGQISSATSGNRLAKAEPAQDMKAILKSQWPKIQAVMPKTMSSERLFQLSVSAYNSEPKLTQCSAVSVLSCVMKCAALGLEPSAVDNLGRAYILPFFDGKTHRLEATFILGYKGMLDLARRSGELTSISARAVHEGDEFSYSYGLDETLRHVPSTAPLDGRPLTHVYCVAHFKDGGHYFIVLSREEVEAARSASKAGKSGPWVSNYESMAIKTAVRRAFPYLPVSVVAQEAAASDEQTPDYSGTLEPIIGAPENVDVETGEVVEPQAEDGKNPAANADAVTDTYDEDQKF